MPIILRGYVGSTLEVSNTFGSTDEVEWSQNGFRDSKVFVKSVWVSPSRALFFVM